MARAGLRLGRAVVRPIWHRLENFVDPPIVILLYHRVTTLAADPQQLAVSPEHFRAQLLLLKHHLPILRFEEDWSRVKQPAVVITFDDGYADNLYEALPILEELQVPATFFICVGQIGTQQEFWWDELERILLGDRFYPASFTLEDAQYGQSWPTATNDDRQQLYDQLHPLIKQVDAPQWTKWLAQLRVWANLDDQGRHSHRAMTSTELQQFAQSPLVTIGAHTLTHSRLAAQSAARQAEEIQGSKQKLEAWLARPVPTFSYPFGGRHDYNQQTLAVCKTSGFTKVAANYAGQAHRWSDRYQLPRQLVRDWAPERFAQALARFWVT
ncbi:N/A [soil metagenome]